MPVRPVPVRAPQVGISPLAAASPEERLKLLMTRESGLTVAEAADRLRSFGRNQPVRSAARHPARDFLDEFTHTLALLLWFAAGLAFAAGITELGAAILAVLVINGVFAFIQEYRAGQVVEGLLRQVAVRATVIRDGASQSLEAGIVVPGDIVQLTAGHVAPADCVLLSDDGLTVDLSLLTGETLPVERDASSVSVAEDAHIADVACLVPAGAGIVTGSGRPVRRRALAMGHEQGARSGGLRR